MATRSAQYYRDYREKNRDRINARRRELYHRRKSLGKKENVTELFSYGADGLAGNKAASQLKEASKINITNQYETARPTPERGEIMDSEQLRQIVREVMGELVLFPVVRNKDVVRKGKPRKGFGVLCYSVLISFGSNSPKLCFVLYCLNGRKQLYT